MDALRKSELVKRIVAKCTGMASSRKSVKCSRCGYINGMVKKAVNSIGIVHDRSRITDGSLEECKSAISHTKESKASFNLINNLNPIRVLSLLKKMLDEVQ